MDKKQLLGSNTAKGGFANEKAVVEKLNHWQTDKEAQEWLKIMGYDTAKLDSLQAIQIPTRIKKTDMAKYGVAEDEYEKFTRFKKADVQIKVIIQIGGILKIENLSLKKANSKANFNQIDKRKVVDYQIMWGFDEDIALWLKLFSGDLLAKNHAFLFKDVIFREEKRIFLDEMPLFIQEKIIDFFDKNRILIVSDILRGRGGLAADWILVTEQHDNQTTTWVLKDINTVLNFTVVEKSKFRPKEA